MPAKSKHMERRKQRIANAKKNARLAAKMRRRRQWQALGGLLAIAAALTFGYLWMTGFFEEEPEPIEPDPTAEISDLPTEEPPAEDASESPAEGASEEAPTDEAASENAENE